MKAAAIILAAGESKRLSCKQKKPYLLINKKPVAVYSLEKFDASALIKEIILVVSREDIKDAGRLLKKHNLKTDIKIVAGGKKRSDSSYQGLSAVSEDINYVIIHDAARPFFNKASIKKLLYQLKTCQGAILAVAATSTIKEVKGNLLVKNTLKRNCLYEAQTPQAFRKKDILKAFRKLRAGKKLVTDDAQLIELSGGRVKVVKGDYGNFKITTPEDLKLARLKAKG